MRSLPGLRDLARAALLTEPVTLAGAAIVMVVSAQPDLPQAPRLAVAVSFIIAAMILVVAVRPWWGRTERTKGDAAVLVLPLVAVAVGTAVVVPDSWSVRGGPGLLPLLPVLSAGPWAAIALRPTSGLRRVVRLVLACALVIPLGFAAFAVAGVYVTPVLLFVTLVLLLVRASSSVGSTAPGAPVTAVLAVAAVTAGLAAIPWWGIDDPVLWMVAPVPAALMAVGLFPGAVVAPPVDCRSSLAACSIDDGRGPP